MQCEASLDKCHFADSQSVVSVVVKGAAVDVGSVTTNGVVTFWESVVDTGVSVVNIGTKVVSFSLPVGAEVVSGSSLVSSFPGFVVVRVSFDPGATEVTISISPPHTSRTAHSRSAKKEAQQPSDELWKMASFPFHSFG